MITFFLQIKLCDGLWVQKETIKCVDGVVYVHYTIFGLQSDSR